MSTHNLPPLPAISKCFQIPKSDQEKNDERASFSSYHEIISKLPIETRWQRTVLRNYNGFWIPDASLYGILASNDRLQFHDDDVLLTSCMKSGTNWLCALTFAIINRSNLNFRDILSVHHPLDCIAFLERIFKYENYEKYPDLNLLPSPRIMATHTPYSLLPESARSSACKIIYICRDPKDAIVSLWHFIKAFKGEEKEPLTFDKAFELFSDGASPYGPVWDQMTEYWNESLRQPEKVMFLKYEELMADPKKQVKRLADFMGCSFSEDEEKDGVVEEIVTFCSFEKLKGLEVNRVGDSGFVANSKFFRNGKVGDWEQHMTQEMAEKLDDIIYQKLLGSGLGFSRRV